MPVENFKQVCYSGKFMMSSLKLNSKHNWVILRTVTLLAQLKVSLTSIPTPSQLKLLKVAFIFLEVNNKTASDLWAFSFQ